MGRRYDDDVDVQLGGGDAQGQDPAAFLWQERLYQVREVLGHWYERAPWWEGAGAHRLAEESGEREVWRVAASAGRMRGTGTYDLARSRVGGAIGTGDPVAGGGAGSCGVGGTVAGASSWRLLGVVD